MLTIRKIEGLKPRLRLRKCSSLLVADSNDDYIRALDGIVQKLDFLSEGDKERFHRLYMKYLEDRDILYLKDINQLALQALGEEMADWDSLDAEGHLDGASRRIKAHSLFLDRVRSPYNIGAIFRSAESFCVDHIYLREGCGDVGSPRCLRTSRGAVDVVPHTVVEDLSILKGRTVFALETGGDKISDFHFPQDGICVIGSEEDGVSPDVLALCDGRVSIEQFGAKGSLNVSVATGIMLHSWALA